jgi:hypothetical protein
MCFAMSNVFCDVKCALRCQMCFAMSNVFRDLSNVFWNVKCVSRCQMCFAMSHVCWLFKMCFVKCKYMSRKLVNVFENREMRFGFLVLCFALMGHRTIQGENPVFLPNTSTFTDKLVQEAHLRTLHGRVGLTMAQIRKRYWVPKLRSLAKQQIKTCCGCRRFQATAVVKPPPGILHELYEAKDGLV